MADSSQGTLRMIYKVNDGAINRSFGIDVAKMAHFPQDVINMAQTKANELETFEEQQQSENKNENENDDDSNDEVELDDECYKTMETLLEKYEEFKKSDKNSIQDFNKFRFAFELSVCFCLFLFDVKQN